MSSATFQPGAANLPPSMSGPGSTSNTNPFHQAVVHGHMTGPLTSSQMSQQSPSVNPEEKSPAFIPADENPYQHPTSHPMGSAYDVPPLQSHTTGSFPPSSSPPSGQQQQSPPSNGQMTAMQPYRHIPQTSTPIDGGRQGGQTFIPRSQPEYPPPPGSLPPAHIQSMPTGTSTFNSGRQSGYFPPPQSTPQSFSHIPNNPTGSPPHYSPHQYNQYSYNNNSWTGTSQQNNNFHGNERGTEFGQLRQPQPQPQPQPQNLPQICAPGQHSFTTKHGVSTISYRT